MHACFTTSMWCMYCVTLSEYRFCAQNISPQANASFLSLYLPLFSTCTQRWWWRAITHGIMCEFAYAQIVLPFSGATSDTLEILEIFHKNIWNKINQTTPFSMNSKLNNHEEDYCSQMIDDVIQRNRDCWHSVAVDHLCRSHCICWAHFPIHRVTAQRWTMTKREPFCYIRYYFHARIVRTFVCAMCDSIVVCMLCDSSRVRACKVINPHHTRRFFCVPHPPTKNTLVGEGDCLRMLCARGKQVHHSISVWHQQTRAQFLWCL